MASLETLTQQQENLNSSITNLIEKQRLVKENIDKIKILNKKKEQVDSMDHRSKKMLESKGTQIDWTRHKMYSLILLKFLRAFDTVAALINCGRAPIIVKIFIIIF